MQLQITVPDPAAQAGTELGHAGARAAADRADRLTPGWSERAYGVLREYASAHASVTSEAVRRWAEANTDLPPPPDGRAWGAVMLRARREGWLVHEGYVRATDPRVHGNPVGIWSSRLAQAVQ